MRIFGLNRKIIRVLLGTEYAHMLEYRAEIALWALSGVLPFIMLSLWNGSDARGVLGMDGVGLDRYFLSAFLVRQFSVVWMVSLLLFENTNPLYTVSIVKRENTNTKLICLPES